MTSIDTNNQIYSQKNKSDDIIVEGKTLKLYNNSNTTNLEKFGNRKDKNNCGC